MADGGRQYFSVLLNLLGSIPFHQKKHLSGNSGQKSRTSRMDSRKGSKTIEIENLEKNEI